MAKRTQLPKGTGRGRTKQAAAPVARSINSRILLLIVIGVVVLVAAGIVLLQIQSLSRSPEVAGSVGEWTTWGPASAPVQIIEYSNFGCGYCRNFALGPGKQIRDEYEGTGKVHFEFKQFRLGDQSTTDAANASECAADQGRFWDYHDLLFSQQGVSADPFTRSALKQYAAQLGLDTARFNRCVDDSQHLEKVYRDTQEGQKQGVTGTPAFFINGEKVPGYISYDALKGKIEAASQGTP